MGTLNKMPTAVLLCLLMVLAAALLGAGGSMRTLRSQAEDAFFESELLMGDLNDVASAGYNLTVIAKGYLSEGDSAVAEVHKNRDAIGQADTPYGKYQAMLRLGDSAGVLYEALRAQPLTEEDGNRLERQMYDIASATRGFRNTPDYNQAAQEFNRTLGSFPAGWFARLTGVKPLELLT